MKSIKSQNGMTGIGWMIVLFLIGFFAYILILLTPIYLENYSVKSVISDLADGSERFSTSSALRKIIHKRFDINMTTSVTAAEIEISRDANMFLVDVEYEVREPFIGNIDLYITFKYVVKIPAADE
ncbi:MAG: DUF4845 domain-containing protein [Gammaproteobacteria bacterium]